MKRGCVAGAVMAFVLLSGGCWSEGPAPRGSESAVDLTDIERSAVIEEVEAAVWAFHAADTAMDANGVVSLLWPEYEMVADGARVTYDDVVQGSHTYMASLDFFHTTWSDLRVVPLTRDLAVSSFFFRDSIGSKTGELTRNRGPNTFVWERRGGVWRVRFGDADHYPVTP